jgi:hypothetical protein
MNKSEGRFFAYVTGLRGPVPVIFHDGIRLSEEKTVLVKWELGEFVVEDASLKGLQKLYPFPVRQMEIPASQVEKSE